MSKPRTHTKNPFLQSASSTPLQNQVFYLAQMCSSNNMRAAVKRAHLLQFTHDESQGLPSTGLGQPEEKTQLAATPRGPALNTAASPDLLWTQATTQVPNSAVLCDGGNRWKQGGGRTTGSYFKPPTGIRDQTVALFANSYRAPRDNNV